MDTKKIKYHIFGTTFLVFLLSSCITNKTTGLLQEGIGMPKYETSQYDYYRIQPLDELVIQVVSINEEVISLFKTEGGGSSGIPKSTYKVYNDGTIDIPFITGIYVKDLTLREASNVIQQSVREFAPDAFVKVGLSNDYFYILTDNQNGKYPIYKEKLTIFQAVSMAGGMPTNADRSRVRIIRKIPNQLHPIVKEFDLRSKHIIGSEFYYIQPNDMIYISSVKSNFYGVSNYSATIISITSTLSFLLLVLGLF